MRGLLGGGFWGLFLGGLAAVAMSLIGEQPARDVLPQVTDVPSVSPSVVETTALASPPQEAEPEPQTPEDVPVEVAPEVVTPPPVVTSETVEGQNVGGITDAAPLAENVESVDAQTDAAAPVEQTEVTETDAATVDPTSADDTTEASNVDAQTNAPEGAPIVAQTDLDLNVTPETSPSINTQSPAGVTTALGDVQTNLSDTDTVAAPTVADAGVLSSPPEVPEAGTLLAGLEDPVIPNPQTAPPEAPLPDSVLLADDTPSFEDAAPLPDVVSDAPVADPNPLADTDPVVTGSTDPSPLTPQSPISPADPGAGDTAPESLNGNSEAEVVTVVDEPAVSVLPTGNSGVVVNRLTGSSGTLTFDAEETAPDEEEVFAEDTPALIRYAAAFEDTSDLPEVAVVLIDDGSFDGALASVVGLNFPVTVMLDPAAPEAAARMDAYRSAGIEVGVLADLPEAATATDAAIYFEAAMAELPETVAILDPGTADLQPDVTRELVAVAAEEGHGLIAFSRGLSSADRIAADRGVAAAVIYRDLDSEEQDAAVIRRFMDQAAFRARQTSGVVMIGRIRGETITALIQWGAASRAGQVQMVPVSAILQGDT